MKYIKKPNNTNTVAYCYGCALQSINDCKKQCFDKGQAMNYIRKAILTPNYGYCVCIGVCDKCDYQCLGRS